MFAVSNAGGGSSDIVVDILRLWYATRLEWWNYVVGAWVTPARACFLSAGFVLLLSTGLALALPDSLVPPLCPHKYKEFSDESSTSSGRCSPCSVVVQAFSLLKDRNLWRVCIVATCLTFTKMQWHHMNATLPKYLVRQLGETVPWGAINSIDYFLCAALAPLLAWATGHWHDANAIIIGSFVMSVSPIFMTLEVSIRASCAWLVLMSIGEVIWNPRFTTYTANLSPHGREGVFLVLAYVPTFIGGLPAGWLSGELLSRYSPDCPSCRETEGAFCQVNCAHPGSACNATNRLTDQLLCTSFKNSGTCLSRQWPGLDACPVSCATCPGWSEHADGPSLWLWVLILATTGPVLLFVFRRLLLQDANKDTVCHMDDCDIKKACPEVVGVTIDNYVERD